MTCPQSATVCGSDVLRSGSRHGLTSRHALSAKPMLQSPAGCAAPNKHLWCLITRAGLSCGIMLKTSHIAQPWHMGVVGGPALKDAVQST